MQGCARGALLEVAEMSIVNGTSKKGKQEKETTALVAFDGNIRRFGSSLMVYILME